MVREKIMSVEGGEKEKRFLERDEILQRLADSMRAAIAIKGEEKIFEYGGARMEDVVTLPRERALKLKAKREPLIERGVKELEKMIARKEIAPDFFRGGTAELAEFASQALEIAIKMIEQEKK